MICHLLVLGAARSKVHLIKYFGELFLPYGWSSVEICTVCIGIIKMVHHRTYEKWVLPARKQGSSAHKGQYYDLKWIGQVQMWFILLENHNLDLTNSFWLWPFHFGWDQIIMVKSKSIWSDQNHFGPTKTVLVT